MLKESILEKFEELVNVENSFHDILDEKIREASDIQKTITSTNMVSYLYIL